MKHRTTIQKNKFQIKPEQTSERYYSSTEVEKFLEEKNSILLDENRQLHLEISRLTDKASETSQIIKDLKDYVQRTKALKGIF